MSGLGTDVLAVVCILGGAAVSGGATLATLRDGPQPADCTSTVVTVPRVSVGVGRAPEVVVRPRILEVHGAHGCRSVVIDRDVRVRIDEARARAEEVRVRMEHAQERIEAAQARVAEAQARAQAAQARTQVRVVVPADEIRTTLEQELARVEKELARLNGGGEGR
jgi:hypothetical protein